jgi:surface protein
MKIVYMILLALVSQLSIAQSDFVTRWNLATAGSGATQLSFGVATSGPVNYSWQAVAPGTASGSGVFNGATALIANLPAGAIIELRISPANFQRIIINEGKEKNRLIDISQWGTVTWTSMAHAFVGCSKLQISATDLPNLSEVTDMQVMFRFCYELNGPANIGDWDTGNVNIMFGMFNDAFAFNQPIGNWNTQNVTTMRNMFRNTTAFNQPIGNWDTRNVTNMHSMFFEAQAFNQPIGNWNVQNVATMQYMFGSTTAFDQSIGNWTLRPSVELFSIFWNSALSCYAYSETLKGWSANPATPNGLTLEATGVTYGPSAVAAHYNLKVAKGWRMDGDKLSSTECLGPRSYFTSRWDLSKAGSGTTQLSFGVGTSGPVDYTWKEVAPGSATGSGTISGTTATITGLPAGAMIHLQISPVNFERIVINNGADKDRLVNVTQWGTPFWRSMAEAFYGCTNLQINATDVPDLSLVTDMRSMFRGCTILDGPLNIGTWNTQNIGNMSSMFNGASAFDRNIGSWNTQNVTDMSNLFDGATVFDQSLGNWTLRAAVNLASIFDHSGLGCYSYGETLKGWSTNPAMPNGLSLVTTGKTYSPGAANARNNLITTKGWTIAGDTPSGAECSAPLSVTQFVTRWDLSTAGSGSTQLSFGVATSGSVNYTWTEISPGVATGSGTFSGSTATITGLPAGATIELRISPTNFQRLMINNGADKNRLIDVSQWGSTSWSSMGTAFYGCARLKISASDMPNLSGVTDMSSMFNGCAVLNSPINIHNWNTENVENMAEMFRSAIAFNQPIGNWNTQNVTSFSKMFNGASAFNQPLVWVTQNALNMSEMFYGASAFNQAIGGWDTEKVANMNGMLREAVAFNQPISTWKTANVVDMAFLFRDATIFNQPIGNWNTQKVTAMNGLFQNAIAFNRPLTWNTQNVMNMNDMFRGARAFNQAIGNWNTEKVTNMSGLFRDAVAFNQSVGNWNTQMVTDMNAMFQGAGIFNQSIGTWTLNSSVNLTSIFTNSGLNCMNYSETLKGWAANPATPDGRNLEVNGRRYNPSATDARNDLINVKGWTITGDIAVLSDCATPLATTQFVTRWNLSVAGSGANQLSFGVGTSGTVNYTWNEVSPGTATGSGTFSGATATITGLPSGATIELRISPTNFQRFVINNGPDRNRLGDVSQWGGAVWTTMVNAFSQCINLQISATDVPNLSLVADMTFMFYGCGVLNSPANIGSWNTQNVQNMSYLFYGAHAFNQPIGNWNTQNVRDMTGMFRETRVFNQPIGNWNTQNVTLMNQMFLRAEAFNQPIGNWNTQNVSNMASMFGETPAFNQPIGKWDTENVTNMGAMFSDAWAFNQPIGTWNTRHVTNMAGMFQNAVAFNQPIGSWNVQIVVNMNNMFNGASAFDQSLGNWTLNASQGLTSIFTNSGLSCFNYSETLKGWSANPSTPSFRTLNADGRTYSPSAAAARSQLGIAKGWSITGDAASATECPPPLSAYQFITRWDLSKTGSGATQLSFGVVTSGSVSYTWTEVSPGTVSGLGTFSGATATITGLPSGATIELRIWPDNMQGIAIDNGSDKNRLVDVKQWGKATWRSFASGFYGCSNLQISATDLPDLNEADNLSGMFRACTVLNGPVNIGSWNTKNVQDMKEMFAGATAFNQPIGNWNIQNVWDMSSMFLNAHAFDQSLGNWTLNLFVYLESIFENSGLSCHNYSETLKGWSANPDTPHFLSLDASGRSYGPSAENDRNNLINSKEWYIYGDVASSTECSNPLPVTLVSFSGQKNSENQNVLKWTTVSEKDFDHFEVQRSADARSFEKIGVVYGKTTGTTHPSTLVEYSFTDRPTGFTNYYRLKMIDRAANGLDGSFAYSRILSIKNEGAQTVVGSFYPNPSSGIVSVDVNTLESGLWVMTVFDASGKNIYKRTYDLHKGKNTISLELFAVGINLVRFEYGWFSEVRKLIKK